MVENQERSMTVPLVEKPSLREVYKRLHRLSFLEVTNGEEGVEAKRVEARGLKGEALRGHRLHLNRFRAELAYTLAANQSEARRRVQATRALLDYFALLEPLVEPEWGALWQVVSLALEDAERVVGVEVDALLAENEVLNRHLGDAERRESQLRREVEQVSQELRETILQNEGLRAKLARLEAVSDEALKSRLMAWLVQNEGAVDLSAFAQANKVPESRAEQALEFLVQEGYLQPSGAVGRA